MNKLKKYIYIINYPDLEKDLCLLEIRTIFNQEPKGKLLISDIDFDPSDSVFIRGKIEPIYIVDTFQEILDKLEEDKLKIEEFRIELIKELDPGISYKDRLFYFNKIGERITGFPNIKNPKVRLGICKLNNKWIFGFHYKNNAKWSLHTKKPYSYSNSLDVKIARTLVNLATKGDKSKTVIDPCCGVGTTIVEGLSMGVDIIGSDINKKNIHNAKVNLEFFNLEPQVKSQDMLTITKFYHSSIIDIPYGLFSHITKEDQQNLISKARSISKRLILVTFEDLDYMIEIANFKIIDRCIVPKGKFKRYILICE